MKTAIDTIREALEKIWLNATSHGTKEPYATQSERALAALKSLEGKPSEPRLTVDQVMEVVEQWLAREANSTIERMRADEYAQRVTKSIRARLTQSAKP